MGKHLQEQRGSVEFSSTAWPASHQLGQILVVSNKRLELVLGNRWRSFAALSARC